MFPVGSTPGWSDKKVLAVADKRAVRVGGGSQRTVKDCSIFTTMKGFDGGTFAVFWDAC